MRIHILGICGTFMGGVALIARELGHHVTGSDLNVYPPMSDALKSSVIPVHIGYEPSAIDSKTDLVIIGNGIARQNPCVDYILNQGINYTSGSQWMCENVLRFQHVLAVSGTHGKTTTTAILAWILETAGLNPGFLIGGVPKNFPNTARLGGGKYFVIEADEYDHADIFPDLEAIKKQFQYLLRIVPSNGSVFFPKCDANIQDVLLRGCWAKQIPIGEYKEQRASASEMVREATTTWHATLISQDGSAFECYFQGEKRATIRWSLLGNHNINNALAAIAAADSIGVSIQHIEKAFATFENVKRRLEIRGCVNDITVYDDFAHHPTAIETTIDGLRKKVGKEKIIVIAQLGSNSMRMGAHGDALGVSFHAADEVHILKPDDKSWDVKTVLKPLGNKAFVHDTVSDIVNTVSKSAVKNNHILIISNKGFDGIHEKLLK